ncbi:Na+/H+ antiporter [Paraconexibacter algicola]|uniref:Na+/H+ antiporter n=1 Tax=Paraconexibacter algicola TaxID=2133960 RepID=A0A2T4UFF7_9ACTN|nr:Na+/H+ antiporter [Paraconexibacter algicola]PTL56500.1 Na+/H+ antiporter [Paraconexibacter algicola]
MSGLLAATEGGAAFDLQLLGILVAVAVLLLAAYRTALPYPILLVVGGALLALVPGIPEVELAPELVLVIALPPLLYSAAFFSSLSDLRENVQPIALLAVGAVIITVLGVAVVAHTIIDGLSWEAAFVLGAVLSPTDPVAATAIAGRVGAPRRFVSIVEGESLVNDSTALICFKFAVAAAAGGSFSLMEASGAFVWGAVAGVAIGLAVGWLVAQLRARLDDAPTEITISLLTPYFAYLPAEAAGVSAVLAAVVSGIFLGFRSPHLITPQTRIQAFAVWEIVVFVLNAMLFVLLGLQLPAVVEGLEGYGALELAWYAFAVTAAVVVLRFVWVFPMTYLPQKLWRPRSGRPARRTPPWQYPLLVSWTGMRGAVSLAAALAIPLETDAGEALPGREIVVFCTYAVIMATLLVQGLSLSYVIRWLGVEEDGSRHAEHEARARIAAARAALERLEQLEAEDWVRRPTHQRMRGLYEFRIRRFEARFDDEDDGDIERGSLAYQRLRREVLDAEYAEIIRLRNRGEIDDEVMRRIMYDLDLEHTRLEI